MTDQFMKTLNILYVQVQVNQCYRYSRIVDIEGVLFSLQLNRFGRTRKIGVVSTLQQI